MEISSIQVPIAQQLIFRIGPAFVLMIAVTALVLISRTIYNLYFHPLASYPGPKSAGISDLRYCLSWLGGRYAYDLDALHKQYGPFVRIARNDLSIATIDAQKEIYGHAKVGKPVYLKTSWYDRLAFKVPSMVTEKNPEIHRAARKSLSHAFSAAALRTQEDVVNSYIDLLMGHMIDASASPAGMEVNMWFNWITFGIIHDLAFGEPFDSDGKTQSHDWVAIIGDSTFAQSLADVYRRLPEVKSLLKYFFANPELDQKLINHTQRIKDAVQRRLNNDEANERVDFFAHLIKKKEQHIHEDFFFSNANLLMIAGSETTATFLAGVTFYLLKDPQSFQRLRAELDEAFQTEEDITGDETAKLPYLFAVIEEGLRIFPPVSFGLPRVSPGALIDGHYVPAGTSISTPPWTMTHSPAYWHKPDTFAPERWLPTDHVYYDAVYANDQKDASKPFSSGPRACLGINLAYLEMRLILAKLVWRFDWHPVRDLSTMDWNEETKMEMLWKKPDMRMRFIDRRT